MAYSFVEIAKECPDQLLAGVINTMLEDDHFLSVLPLEHWNGQKKVTYNREQSLPTVSSIAWDGSISSTEGVYQQVSVELKEYVGQFDINRRSGSLGADVKSRLKSHARALGSELRDDLIDSCSTTVAVGATVISNGISESPSHGARIDPGLGYLKWEKDDDKLYFKAPGDDYGSAITTISGVAEATRTLKSENESFFIDLKVDGTTLGDVADFETSNAATGLTFTSSNSIDGLYRLVEPSMIWYGNRSATAGSTNGDAISLAALWFLLKQVKGPNKVFVVNPRTEISIRGLIDGNATVDEFMGVKLSKPVISFGGCPIFSSDAVTIDETQGSTDTCTSVFLASLDADEGLVGWYGTPDGASMVHLPDDSLPSGNDVPLPVALDNLGIVDDKNYIRYRLTSYFTLGLKNSQALGRLRAITD